MLEVMGDLQAAHAYVAQTALIGGGLCACESCTFLNGFVKHVPQIQPVVIKYVNTTSACFYVYQCMANKRSVEFFISELNQNPSIDTKPEIDAFDLLTGSTTYQVNGPELPPPPPKTNELAIRGRLVEVYEARMDDVPSKRPNTVIRNRRRDDR